MTWSRTHAMPLPAVSAGNSREHHMARARRVSAQRQIGYLLVAANSGRPALPVVVTLTRIAKRALDAHDNLPIAFKAVVDGIADAYDIHDNDPRISWRYANEKGSTPAIRIEIEARA